MSNNTETAGNGYKTTAIAEFLKREISANTLAGYIDEIAKNYVSMLSEDDFCESMKDQYYWLIRLRGLLLSTAIENGEDLADFHKIIIEM